MDPNVCGSILSASGAGSNRPTFGYHARIHIRCGGPGLQDALWQRSLKQWMQERAMGSIPKGAIEQESDH